MLKEFDKIFTSIKKNFPASPKILKFVILLVSKTFVLSDLQFLHDMEDFTVALRF